MKHISEISEQECSAIKAIFFDIDDTFTLDGKIPKESYNALWALKEAGLSLVPVTGRPAGWCDHIARMWPVDGVIGENGAFYFYYDEKETRRRDHYFFSPEEAKEKRAELEKIKDEILESVPEAGLASDQAYRIFDLAIDFAEDVGPLPDEDVDRICSIFAIHGARYKVSSIHVNGWFGDYDKLIMTKVFMEERLGMDIENSDQGALFVGDSPNDEPMFRFFDLSIGVANIARFKDRIEHLPAYVTRARGGLGFAEMAKVILEKRK